MRSITTFLALAACALPAFVVPAFVLPALVSPAFLAPASAQEPAHERRGEPSSRSALFDAQGYRIARYRSPIAADPHPAPRITLAEALRLDPRKDALFLDVMPVHSGMRDPASGEWTLSQTHRTIPGAEWHPEAGRVPADDDLWQAFEAQAREASPARPVIIFCRIDCWMSWNAAKKLSELGIDNVWWLAEGTDGWHSAGRDLVAAEPVVVAAER